MTIDNKTLFCPMIKNYCKRDECAFWDGYCCSVVSISLIETELRKMRDGIAELKRAVERKK